MLTLTIENIAKLIEKTLQETGISVEELCADRGLSTSKARTMRRIINREIERPGLPMLNDILGALGYDILIVGKPNKGGLKILKL